MIENIRLSFQGIWAHKMRSFLTMLGIIIGIAAIISIVSTIKGTNEQIKQNLIGAGNNVTRVQLYRADNSDYPYGMDEGIPQGIPQISSGTLDEIAAMDDVVSASAYTRRNYGYSYYYGNVELSSCPTYGVDNNYFTTCGYSVKRGRMFVPKDFTDFRPVAVIDDNTAKSLFQSEDPIGKTIEYNSIALVVVGVVELDTKFEPVINSEEDYYTYMNNRNAGAVFLPNVIWPTLFAYDEPQELAVRVSYTEAMSKVGKDVAELLNTHCTNETIVYKAENTLEKAKDLQDLSNATNQQLVWIASISLLVGGIGVMNIMLVSVTERTREIGLKKAIGAKKSRILWQFLTEAAVLTSLGGVLGVGAGIGMAELISNVAQTPVAISVPAIFLGVLFSMVIGIIFGLIPSVKAANLNPIDALRHE
ncbi:FtsX-like permease family protein [Acutalibacter sp. 1XD8-33]|uniref:ABC transporter permease n=1 Tax=Acutalibacter sp. 1XD8-33 TaxID=2320081 RepID=UPI000EA02E7C|nr:ABC transporter permease [Acutalibacter sp. 1XD8-33]RKJ39609.1 FtsX-like permease family protein [Acutalibacter sp. 1XD8-33]